MKYIIIEDELLNYQYLCKQLRMVDNKCKISLPATTIAEARLFIETAQSDDIIFSDIRLADGLVFEAFNGINLCCPVIFVTAYDEYAIRSFDYNAIAYLLKPIQQDKLRHALQRVGNAFDANRISIEQLARLLKAEVPAYRQRFIVERGDHCEIISVEDVRCIMVADGVTQLLLGHDRHLSVPFSLDTLERQLDPKFFFRATRQHIVNINFVHTLHRWFNQKLHVQIDGLPEFRIEVSRERSIRLKQWIDTFSNL